MGWHRIVLGIGNPGPEYDKTRHNVGFMVLDLLAERLGLAFARLDRHADGLRKNHLIDPWPMLHGSIGTRTMVRVPSRAR